MKLLIWIKLDVVLFVLSIGKASGYGTSKGRIFSKYRTSHRNTRWSVDPWHDPPSPVYRCDFVIYWWLIHIITWSRKRRPLAISNQKYQYISRGASNGTRWNCLLSVRCLSFVLFSLSFAFSFFSYLQYSFLFSFFFNFTIRSMRERGKKERLNSAWGLHGQGPNAPPIIHSEYWYRKTRRSVPPSLQWKCLTLFGWSLFRRSDHSY